MNRFYAILSLCATILVISCNDDSDEPVFTMIYEVDYNIPAGLNAFANHFFIANDIKTRIDDFSGSFPVEDITAIRTIRATVNPVFDNTDFSNVDEAIIDISDPKDENNIFEAAYTIQVPDRTLSELEMVPSSNNLIEIMTLPEFDLSFQFRLRSVSTVGRTWRLRLEMGAFE